MRLPSSKRAGRGEQNERFWVAFLSLKGGGQKGVGAASRRSPNGRRHWTYVIGPTMLPRIPCGTARSRTQFMGHCGVAPTPSCPPPFRERDATETGSFCALPTGTSLGNRSQFQILLPCTERGCGRWVTVGLAASTIPTSRCPCEGEGMRKSSLPKRPLARTPSKSSAKKLTLKEWLLAESPRLDIPLPPRGNWRHRLPFKFEH
jgi:hypothetical protein